MNQTIKWGVLGTAGIAESCTIPGMLLAQNCELTAIAGRKPEKVRRFREKFGFRRSYDSYEGLLEDPEIQAVYIPLPNHLHYEWVIKALRAGKHVLCEKPLAPTEAQARQMFALAQEKNLFLMEAFAYLHSPWITEIKRTLDSGIIGRPVYMESEFMTTDFDLSNIRMRRETLGGSMFDLGCYTTSMILWMMGDAPRQIQAVAQFTPQQVDCMATGILTFPDGAMGSFRCGMNLLGSPFRRLDHLFIHGTRGSIQSDVQFNQAGVLSYTLTADGETSVHTVSVPQNYGLEISQLGQCILGEDQPLVSAAFSIKNARVVEQILKEIGYIKEDD